MLTSFIETIAHGFTNLLTPPGQNDPIVRLFEVEYNKEYTALRKLGVEVNRKLALEHMSL